MMAFNSWICFQINAYAYNSSGFLFVCLFFPQNLNKQAYDLAKALLKRTAQAIEPYITNVSEGCKQIWKSILSVTELCYKKNELHTVKQG